MTAYVKRRNDLMIALLFLAPSLLIFTVFVFYPLIGNVYLSTTSWNFLSPKKTFVGLANYERLLEDPRFWDVAWNTVWYGIAHVALSMVLGLGLALLLSKPLRGRSIFRMLFFFPNITTTSAVALLWIWIYDPRYGLLNYFLGLFGIQGPHWLLDADWAMWALIIFSTWRTAGYVMLIYLGGLLSIPRDFYEAAQIDGAGPIQVFLKITFPLLSPTTFFLVVTSLIASFQVFDAVAVLTRGGPAGATKVMNYQIWQKAFVEFNAGQASAMATILFIAILALTLMQNVLSKRWVHYSV